MYRVCTLMFQSLEAGNSLTLSYIIFTTSSLASGVQPTYYKIFVVGAFNVHRKIGFLHWVFYFPPFNVLISCGFVVYFFKFYSNLTGIFIIILISRFVSIFINNMYKSSSSLLLAFLYTVCNSYL